MLYEILRKKKEEMGLTTERLSQLSGVPVGTINKILNGETRSPRYDTLSALESVLTPQKPYPNMICDSASLLATKQQGTYTIEDYYALPDDLRAELIDGNLIFLEAPSFSHQEIITSLLLEIGLFIRSNKGGCKVLASPLDIQLDCDDRTIVQPDIIVSCDKKKRTERGIYGAPDMCIEIISPSTRKLDYGLKMTKYMNAGIREYWIVDLKREAVVCYYFEGEDYPVMHTFRDKVPVRIFDGRLTIDFSQIKDGLENS